MRSPHPVSQPWYFYYNHTHKKGRVWPLTPFPTETNNWMTPTLAWSLKHTITFAVQQSSDNCAYSLLYVKDLQNFFANQIQSTFMFLVNKTNNLSGRHLKHYSLNYPDWNLPSPIISNKSDQTEHRETESHLFSCEHPLPTKSVTII